MSFWRGQGQRPRSLAGNREVDFSFVPPRSPRIIMTDRGDGTLWMLAFNLGSPSPDGLGYVSIISPPPERPDRGNYRIVGPYDGPFLRAEPSPGQIKTLRLLVRDGYLGYEETDLTTQQGRVTARKGLDAQAREIVVPASWRFEGDLLAWQDVEF